MKTIFPRTCLRCRHVSRAVRWNDQVRGYLCTNDVLCFARAPFNPDWVWPAAPTEDGLADTLEIPIDEDAGWPTRSQNRSAPRWTWCNDCARWGEMRWMRDGYYCPKCRTTEIVYLS